MTIGRSPTSSTATRTTTSSSATWRSPAVFCSWSAWGRDRSRSISHRRKSGDVRPRANAGGARNLRYLRNVLAAHHDGTDDVHHADNDREGDRIGEEAVNRQSQEIVPVGLRQRAGILAANFC